ncbi:MAG: hypothetical protein IJ264_06830 [Clostridia bacterium]|nr:hypothetical protein [Clostridia bacterium]
MADNLLSFDNIKMPYSLEAEQAVLGSILVEPSCLSQAAVYITPEAFYLPQHASIFEAMIAADSTGKIIDPLVILNMLVQQGVYDSASGKNYLFQLKESVPSTANVEMYAKIVREKFYMRTLINISSETIESAVAQEETADVLLDNAEQKIYNIRQGKTTNAP